MGLASENLSRADGVGCCQVNSVWTNCAGTAGTLAVLASGWKTVWTRSLVLQQLLPLDGFFWLLWVQGPAANLIWDKFLTPLSHVRWIC